MRGLVGLLSVLVLLTVGASPLRADVEEVVYLHPDSADRYRPAIDSGGGPFVLADIDSITSPAVSVDGRRVVFSGALGDESLGRYALFVVNANGSGLSQLTGGNYAEFDAAWSRDGETIVAAQNQSGSLLSSDCCRLITVDVDSGSTSVLTNFIGAIRPDLSPNGSFVVYDRPNGVWRIPSQGGVPTRIATVGWDATVSPDSSAVAYLAGAGSSLQLRSVPANGGSATTLYTTSNTIEDPAWRGGRIYFLEYSGDGYDGRSSVRLMSISAGGGGVRTERSFNSHPVGLSPVSNNDEIFFYRNDGTFQYFDISPLAELGNPMSEGTGYSSGWSSISSVDLNGDGQDELLFYRAADGTYKYYRTKPGGGLGALLSGGPGYSRGWSSISAVDLNGDGQDELLFYRSTDGVFKYYETTPNGDLGPLLAGGPGYSRGWSSISAVDLDGDGTDELLFYRGTDGTFKYYKTKPGGGIGAMIRGGSGYSTGWSSITSIDLDGDSQDEIFFYRADGTFRYYDIGATAILGSPVASGSNYMDDWTAITSVNLDG